MEPDDLQLGAFVFETSERPPMRWRIYEVENDARMIEVNGMPQQIVGQDPRHFTFTLGSHGKEREVLGSDLLAGYELWSKVKTHIGRLD